MEPGHRNKVAFTFIVSFILALASANFYAEPRYLPVLAPLALVAALFFALVTVFSGIVLVLGFAYVAVEVWSNRARYVYDLAPKAPRR